MKNILPVISLIVVPGLLLVLAGCGTGVSTEGLVSPPSLTQIASLLPLVSDVAGENSYSADEAMRQAEGYSLSAEIELSATGKKVSIQRDDPRYAEFIKLFQYSTFSAPSAWTAQTKQNANGKTASVTVPYAWGYILTFNLMNGLTIWFNCTSENTWYESKDTIYRGGFDSEFRGFLDALLDGDNLPNSSPPDIAIQPGPGQTLSTGTVLRSVSVRSAILDKDYVDIFNQKQSTVKKGEPCWLVTGQIESQLDADKYMTMYATGFDTNGQEVARILDCGPICGVISVFLPAGGFGGFILHLNAAPEVTRIELYPSNSLSDIPPP